MQTEKRQTLCEICEKTANCIELMQEVFTGMPKEFDTKYNFTNEELEVIEEAYKIIGTKAIHLKE